MPKIPRDLSGADLAKALRQFGYTVTRQSGSHMQLVTDRGQKRPVTIPAHSPLKLGTLSGILTDVATNLGMPKAELVKALFS